MPRVSIVMPVYNSAVYLTEAVESILVQTFKDWELIAIIEAESTDDSAEILKSYAERDDRFTIIENETRLGISSSMNIGLARARGEYIARMDADDISLPSRLERQVRFLEENPDIDLCGVKAQIFGSKSFDWKLETDSEQISANILFYSPCIHPTIMMRTDFLKQHHITYADDYRASEDYDLFAKVCEKGKISNVDQVLFLYRLMNNNATFKNNDTGLVLYKDIMKRQFNRLGLDFSADEMELLSPHGSWEGLDNNQILDRFIYLDVLLKKILKANERQKLYSREALLKTLHKRFTESFNKLIWQDLDTKNINEVYKHSIFSGTALTVKPDKAVSDGPLVSILMPTYNSERYIWETVKSVLEQDYTNFEFLIINEFGNLDDSKFITEIFDDARIRFIQNEERLGLAESLNAGIRIADGKYIARIDADDTAHRERIRRQVEYMEQHPGCGVCGSWQYHFGRDTDMIHKTPVSSSDIEAELIYNCEMCHSTLMLRKDVFLQHQLFFDPDCAAEDYELWTRAIRVTEFANIPEVLGDYRIGSDNITAKKMSALSVESGKLAAQNIEYYFGIVVPEEMQGYLSGWCNEYRSIFDQETRKSRIQEERKILTRMWQVNEESSRIGRDSLEKVILRRWNFINCLSSKDKCTAIKDVLIAEKPVSTEKAVNTAVADQETLREKQEIIQQSKEAAIAVEPVPEPQPKQGSWIKRGIKKVLRIIYNPIRYRTIDYINHNVWEADKDVKKELHKVENSIQNHQKNELLKIKNELQKTLKEYGEQQQKHYRSLTGMIEVSVKDSFEKQEQLVYDMHETLKRQEEIYCDAYERQTQLLFQYISAQFEIQDQKIQDQKFQNHEQQELMLSAIKEEFDSRLWRTEQFIEQKIKTELDSRLWKTEMFLDGKTKEHLEERIWNAEQFIRKQRQLICGDIFNFRYEWEMNQVKDDQSNLNLVYNNAFYDDNRYMSYQSAINTWRVIGKWLFTEEPFSLIDFGCGTGTWLQASKQFGVTEVYGIDGDYVDRQMLMIDPEEFHPYNLQEEVILNRKFDLVMSLEVAEHIEEEYADIFIDSLCRHGEVILFSAAHKGQGGDYHVNEQNIEYWIQKFNDRGYEFIDIRPSISRNYEIESWYRDNIGLYVKAEIKDKMTDKIQSCELNQTN